MRQSPIPFDMELLEEIADHIASGKPMSVKLREISERIGKRLDRRTVNQWRKAHEEVGAMFDEARDAGFDEIADEMLAIADDGSNDYRLDEKRGLMLDQEHIQRSRLRVETREKLLAKWDPRRYGNKLDLNHSGSIQNETEEHLNARIAQLLGKAGASDAAGGEGSPDTSNGA